jgi:hypothetical protein
MTGHSRKPVVGAEKKRRQELVEEALKREPNLTATAVARRTGLPYDWVREEMRTRRVAKDFATLGSSDVIPAADIKTPQSPAMLDAKPAPSVGAIAAPPTAPKPQPTTTEQPIVRVPHHPPFSHQEARQIEDTVKHSPLELNPTQQRIKVYIQNNPRANDARVADVFGVGVALVKYVRRLVKT